MNNKQNSNNSNEQLFINDIWKNNNNNDLVKEDTIQYYNKYNKLREESNIKKKKQLQLNIKNIEISKSNRIGSKNKNKFIENRRKKTKNSSIENISDIDESPSINKINIFEIKSNTMNNIMNKNNNISNNNNKKQQCITEPDEYFYQRPQFIESLPLNYNLNKTPQQMKTFDYNYMTIPNYQTQFSNFPKSINQNSYISTHNSSKIYLSKDTSLFEDDENDFSLSAKYNNNNYLKNRVLTNESNESNNSSKYINTYQNSSRRLFTFDNIQRRVNSSSFTESNYYNAFLLNTSHNFFIHNNFMRNNKQLINLNDIAMGKIDKTTLMIRNIPIKYTDDMLLKELEQFENKFDCLYMPYDFENIGNRGYAFINFINPLHILLFYEKFQGKSWNKFESKKICELNFANFQGIEEIKKHAKNYKGIKKPSFFINTLNSNINIEIPMKFLLILQKRFPKMTYFGNLQGNTFVIKSFNSC